jgi:hypothetical protein
METLLATYAIAALAVGAYAARLVIGTGRISRRLRQLQTRIDRKPETLPAKRIA